jgi:hypothetical protein
MRGDPKAGVTGDPAARERDKLRLGLWSPENKQVAKHKVKEEAE